MLFGLVGLEVCGALRKCPGALGGVGEGEYCTTSQTQLGIRFVGPKAASLSPAAWKPDPRTHL